MIDKIIKLYTDNPKRVIKKALTKATKEMNSLKAGSYEHNRAAEDVKTLTEALNALNEGKKEIDKEIIKGAVYLAVTLLVVYWEADHIITGKKANLIPKPR